ncbi:hypothetical protein KY321_04515, partial [Candidatus Woesearchaeota archaeon]|nr:hypothetical protein [Candidatus Woesearchaeota archaeon]
MKFTKSLLIMLMVLIMSVSVYAACPSNMVSYWQFDDADGTDSKGSNVGTLSSGSEMFTNGNLESGDPYVSTTGWIGRGTTSRVTNLKHAGSYSQKFVATSDVGGHYIAYSQKTDGQLNNFIPGRQYILSAWLYLPSGSFDA